ncbi:hypothetical protein [Oceaniglobus trochenteri]|uniref:hypothetical protein n=1 Tax=Oceaniglobus trochenteri TaxID=2763260 RepID=UPI001D00182F|nr:hypothetical protein [Oceaniglobus trochenteri]
MKLHLTLATALLIATPALSDPAQVEGVTARATDAGWTFSVTLRHGDTGWDDYADGWRVELADGTVAGERPLAHPHETEQPFTRSQSGIRLPEGTDRVFIRARTSVEGWADEATPFDLPG